MLARLTEHGEGSRFWRADAVEVLTPSPDRVERRCPVSGPGLCGGCDFQHVALDAQRRLKADVVAEQLRRLAGLERPVVVEAVPGDDDGLGWRTRVRFAVDARGTAGLRKHRSHELVALDACPIATDDVNAVGVPRRRWPGSEAVEVVAPASTGERLVVVEPAGEADRERGGRRPGRGPRPAPPGRGRVDVPPLPDGVSVARSAGGRLDRVRGRTWVAEHVEVDGRERTYRVTGSGFWQVHPGAARTLLDAVLAAAGPRPGERVVDLYSGAGLFSAGLAERVGPDGAVLAVESDARAVADARRSLHDLPQVRLETGRVEHVLDRFVGPQGEWGGADVVVADPPRTGTGRPLMERLCGLGARVVVLVACDPAAMARDVAAAAGAGYRLAGLRAFDLFPMTHHVECVATLVPDEA